MKKAVGWAKAKGSYVGRCSNIKGSARKKEEEPNPLECHSSRCNFAVWYFVSVPDTEMSQQQVGILSAPFCQQHSMQPNKKKSLLTDPESLHRYFAQNAIN